MRRVVVAAAVPALAALHPASASAKSDIAIGMDDGVSIAVTYYLPDGDVPAGGWPTLLLMHGIGESRTGEDSALGMSLNRIALTLPALPRPVSR